MNEQWIPGPDGSEQGVHELQPEDVYKQWEHTDHLEEQPDTRHKRHDVRVLEIVQEILKWQLYRKLYI